MSVYQKPRIPQRIPVTIPCKRLPPEQCATEADLVRLERNIVQATAKNERTLYASEILAEQSVPVQ